MSAVRVRHRPPTLRGAARAQAGTRQGPPRRIHFETKLTGAARRVFARRQAIGRRKRMADDGRLALPSSGVRTQRCCQIASLSSLEARKATFLLALIWMASPVAGL